MGIISIKIEVHHFSKKIIEYNNRIITRKMSVSKYLSAQTTESEMLTNVYLLWVCGKDHQGPECVGIQKTHLTFRCVSSYINNSANKALKENEVRK